MVEVNSRDQKSNRKIYEGLKLVKKNPNKGGWSHGERGYVDGMQPRF